MDHFISRLTYFGRRKKSFPGTLLRALAVYGLSLGASLAAIYASYYDYWERTIYQNQTVNLNILSSSLPGKLSAYLTKPSLTAAEMADLQQLLDSHSGLFNIVVTDCQTADRHCPEQQVLHASQAPSEGFPEPLLAASPFVVLRDSSPLYQEWAFESPQGRDTGDSDRQSAGDIIGRAYLIRVNRPAFVEELQGWLGAMISGQPGRSDRPQISSPTPVYTFLLVSALVVGSLIFLGLEYACLLITKAQKKEAKALKEKHNTEQKLHQTVEREQQNRRALRQAEETARLASEEQSQALLEKQQAEAAAQAATEAWEQTLREKQQAEAAVQAATEAWEQALQEKQQAEAAAQAATEAWEQTLQEKRAAEEAAQTARKEAQDLYNWIGEDAQESESDRVSETAGSYPTYSTEASENKGAIGAPHWQANATDHSDEQLITFKSTESDYYDQERKEVLLHILKKSVNSVHDSSRQQHILQDILKNNPSSGNRERLKREIQILFRDYRRMDSQRRNALERMGFVIIAETNHYKLRFCGDNRYVVTFAKTASDRRTGKNIASDIGNLVL